MNTLPGCHKHSSLAWRAKPAQAPGWITPQVKEVRGNKAGVVFVYFSLTYAGDVLEDSRFAVLCLSIVYSHLIQVQGIHGVSIAFLNFLL